MGLGERVMEGNLRITEEALTAPIQELIDPFFRKSYLQRVDVGVLFPLIQKGHLLFICLIKKCLLFIKSE